MTEPTPIGDESVSVTVPRPVALIVRRIGWGGLIILLIAAQSAGLLEAGLALLGLPPLGLSAQEASEPTECAELAELAEAHQADMIYRRAMTAETLAILARIEMGCHRE